ncbi:MAG: Endonuclease/exonuclease/phosphatase, partial [Candidatus Shapirobacteria bacterium GW2011_GWF1_38_23]
IFLNAWYGNTGEVLWKYLKEEAKTTDIFCFMEADRKFREKCAEILLDYISMSTEKAIANEDGCFQSTYMKKEYKVLKSEPILGLDPFIGLGLFTKIEADNRTLNIASIHGVAQPGDKLDNPKRLEQSKMVIDYMTKIEGSKIIGGDFNLDKNTESIKMFERNGYRNLIEEYKIDMTRNHLSWDLHPQKQLWADFLFVDPEIKVKNFEVPKNKVSDHLPLVLEIEE